MREILFSILYLGNLYLFGYFISNLLKINFKKWTYISAGFIGQLAIIELLGWWLVAFRQSTNIFTILVICVILSGCFGGIYISCHNKPKQFLSSVKLNWEYFILFFCIIALCLCMYTMYRSDADDSFYVSNVLLFSQEQQLNLYDSSFGNSSLGTVPMYDFQIWESYLSVLCRIFSIKASIMCHFIMVPILLIIAVSAMLTLGDTLFKSTQKNSLFVSLLLIIYMMQGYSVYSKGSFLLSRIWQGKAVYLHVVLPITIAVMLWNIKKTCKMQWFLLAMLTLAGIALNPTSMYVIGFQIVSMGIAILIYEKNWKKIATLFPSILIIGLFTIFILLRTRNYGDQIEAASSVPEHFAYTTVMSFFGNGKLYLYLYLICIIYIVIKGSLKAKMLCVYTPLLLLIAVWNPLMAPLIANNLTMVPSYWRVFWLLPVDYALAYSAISILYHWHKIYWKLPAVIIIMSIIILPGQFMFTSENNFIKCENKERIPSEILCFGELIVKDKNQKQIVLSNDIGATTLRQEYNNIELIYSRPQYILDLILYRGYKQEADERTILMQFVNGTYINKDYSYISQLLTKYNVQWIIINSTTANEDLTFLQNIGYKIKKEMNDLLLLYK